MAEVIRLAGQVSARATGVSSGGAPFVRATVTTDSGEEWEVTWWSTEGPQNGDRVALVGTEKGANSVWVESWHQLLGPTAPRPHVILAYLRACVEADSSEGLAVTTNSPDRLLLTSGESPLLGGLVALPSGPGLERWAVRRITAGAAETLVAGWPVVTGTRRLESKMIDVMAPLIFTQFRVVPQDQDFVLEAAHESVELNVEALALLGVPREERERSADLADSLPSSLSMSQRTDRLLDEVTKAGWLPDVALDPRALGQLSPGARLHNSAVCFVSDGDRSVFTRALLRDLSAMAIRPELELSSGPLGILFGVPASDLDVGPEPSVVVLPANAEQEHAVASAMKADLTVVTGPPGTGKTQVLVNVASAAVAAGQTVLLASKNNHAIDVVVERLRASTPHAAPVRTGSRKFQVSAGEYLASVLAGSTGPSALPDGKVDQQWATTVRSAQPAYEQWAELHRLEGEIAAAQRDLQRHLDALPLAFSSATPLLDRDILAASHLAAVRLLDELEATQRRWWNRRRRKQLEAEADTRILATIGQFADDLQRQLTDTLLRSGPRVALAQVADALLAQELRDRVSRLRSNLDVSPSRDLAWKAVESSLVGRDQVGRKLIDAAWLNRLAGASPSDRAAAAAYSQKVITASASTSSASMPGVLACFPVWATTNLAAGSTLPLGPQMFDLVVIDEASQSDLASSVPLLFRAKRAMVVGDPNQLTHITAISELGDQQLARGAGLTDDEVSVWSYKSTSLFAAASRRYGREPLLLRQHFRSHADIIGFSNREIYGGELVLRTDSGRLIPGQAVRWINVVCDWEPNSAGRSVRKPVEADRAIEVLESQLAELAEAKRSVGIVSPFRAQVDLLRDLLEQRLPDWVGRVTIDTAFGFQGDERDVMIFSPAISPDLKDFTLRFAGSKNLVNVAITRARSRLIIVGDHSAALGSPTLLAGLAQYVSDLKGVEHA